jgi:hypothetical protein
MKTALEYLIKEIAQYDVTINKLPFTFKNICDKAFEMEKHQILLAWENGSLPAFFKEHKCSRDYFEQTYKKHEDETF